MSANVICFSKDFSAPAESAAFRLSGANLEIQCKLNAPSGPVSATVQLYCTNTYQDSDSWMLVASKVFSSPSALVVDSFYASSVLAYGKLAVTSLAGVAHLSVSSADSAKRLVQDVNIIGAEGSVAINVSAGDLSVIGATSDTPAASDTGSFSLMAFIKRILLNWNTLLTRVPNQGPAASAGALPVVLANDDAQIGSKITAAAPLVGGAGIIGWLSTIANALRPGPAARAASLPVTLAQDDAQMQGLLTLLSARLSTVPGVQPIQTKVLLPATTTICNGPVVLDVSGVKTIAAIGLCSSGVGSVVVEYRGSLDNGQTWDIEPLATISLDLSQTPVCESFTTNDRYSHLRADVTNLVGVGATVSSIMGY